MSWQGKVHMITMAMIVLLLSLILYSVDLTRTWRAFLGVNWVWVISVLILNVLNTWVEALRWRLILTSVKKAVRTSSTFAAILVGVVGNTVLPLRLGDGARAYFLAKEEKVKLASSLATVMLDRIVDITFFLIMVVLTGFFFHFPLLVERAGLLAGGALAIGLIVLLALMRFIRHLELKFSGKLGKRLAEQIRRFTMGLSSINDAGILLPTSVLSIFSWAVRCIMVLAMFRAFHLDLPVIAAAVVLILSNLGIAAVSTPANLGVFELSTLAAFKLLQVDTDVALSYTIVLHMVEVIPMVLLGLAVLWLSGVKSSELLRQAELR